MQAVDERSSVSPKVIVFRTRMAAAGNPQPEHPQTPPGFHPPTHGNWAQWAAVIAALLIGGFNTYLIWSGRNADRQSQTSDDHTKGLIQAQINTAKSEIKTDFQTTIKPIADGITDLQTRVGRLEGRFQQLDSEQKKISTRLDQQESLARLIDPNRVLATIRAEIHMAENDKKTLATSTLADYKNALQTFPTTSEYWPVAAQFISYRSRVNVGTAFQTLSRPDMPNCTDSLPTPMEYRMTSEEEWSTKEETNRVGIDSRRFTPAIYENCRFVLDSPEEAKRFPLLGQSFDLEFKNCQIIYNGGPIAIFTPNPRVSLFNGKGPTRGDIFMMNGQKLRFENCLFLFTIKAVPPQEGQQMTHELLAQSGPTLSYGHVSIGGA
jgi:hypothetical protein